LKLPASYGTTGFETPLIARALFKVIDVSQFTKKVEYGS